jgi:hypothetical protein
VADLGSLGRYVGVRIDDKKGNATGDTRSGSVPSYRNENNENFSYVLDIQPVGGVAEVEQWIQSKSAGVMVIVSRSKFGERGGERD